MGSNQQLVHLHPVQVQKVAVTPSRLGMQKDEENQAAHSNESSMYNCTRTPCQGFQVARSFVATQGVLVSRWRKSPSSPPHFVQIARRQKLSAAYFAIAFRHQHGKKHNS